MVDEEDGEVTDEHKDNNSVAKTVPSGGFQEKALNKTPTFAISFCGILISLSLAFRIMGLDVSTPLNRYMAAKSLAIELEVESQSGRKFEEERLEVQNRLQKIEEIIQEGDNSEKMETLSKDIQAIKEDLDKVKSVAHEPRGNLVFK